MIRDINVEAQKELQSTDHKLASYPRSFIHPWTVDGKCIACCLYASYLMPGKRWREISLYHMVAVNVGDQPVAVQSFPSESAGRSV